MIIAGNGIYDYCERCGRLVKLNKFIVGALHPCVDKQAQQEAMIAMQNQYNQMQPSAEEE